MAHAHEPDINPDPPPCIMADTGALDRPVLCVHVDTEEEFDWSKPFSRQSVSVESLGHLRRGHALFRKYALKPVYLAAWPVMDDARAHDTLARWVQDGECLVGAQLHPWVTPPFEEEVSERNSFPCNLPPDLERRKLARLTERITEVTGAAPQIYKAGRYGLDMRREETLSSLGYLVDTSVTPFRSHGRYGGGPDFFGYPPQPFWSAERGEVLFLPVTQRLVGPFRRLSSLRAVRPLFSNGAEKMHLPALFSRLRLLERIMLTPEGITFKEMRRLADHMIARGDRVFCLSLHSPTFMPGCTPYTPTQKAVERFLYNLEAITDYILGDLGGVAMTPLDLRAVFMAARGRPAQRRTDASSNKRKEDSADRYFAAASPGPSDGLSPLP